LPHHDQQASDDRNQTEHGRMLSSNMLLLNVILLIDLTFSTPTPVGVEKVGDGNVFSAAMVRGGRVLSSRLS
jgi:hypothetical protein